MPRVFFGLALVVALSTALRIAMVMQATPPVASDARDYRALAASLARGEGYAQTYHGETPEFEGFTFRAYRLPGYPLLLAAVHGIFGWDVRVALLLNVVADAVTQVAGAILAWTLLGERVALCAALLLGTHVLWTPNPMTESVYTALFAVLASLLVAGRPLASDRAALGWGLIAAAAALTRPVTASFGPALVATGAACPGAPAARRLILAALPVLVTVAAWGARNYSVFGEPVFTSTNVGLHNARDFGIDRPAVFEALRREGRNEVEIDRAFRNLEWQAMIKDPGGAARLFARRALDLFSLRPPWEVRSILWIETFADSPRVRAWYRASYAQYSVTLPLAAVGAALLALRRVPLNGLWTLLASYVALHAMSSRGDFRLAAPLYPLLAFFAAAALVSAGEALAGFASNARAKHQLAISP